MIPVICHNCGATGEVLRVTAGLQCRCGSNDLDLNLDEKTAAGITPQMYHHWSQGLGNDGDSERSDNDDEDDAYDAGVMHGLENETIHPNHTRINPQYNTPGEIEAFKTGHSRGRQMAKEKVASSPGTGWTKKLPDPASNWDEYAGPTPGGNENWGHNTDADGQEHKCPVCNGTGHDPRASGGGYEENVCRNCHGTGKVTYPTENDTPSLDAHKPGGVPLGGGWQGKQSVKIKIGKKTYDADIEFGVKTAANDKFRRLAAKITERNPGLSKQEVESLARRTLEKFPEGPA